MALPAVKKILIPAIICVGVLFLSFFLYIFISQRTAAIRLQAEIEADKNLARLIYHQTGIKIFGTINGEPFLEEDINVYRGELRAAVAAYFGRRYNISSMGASFWDTKYDGITPNEHKTNLAINDLKKNMVIIQQARIRGVDTPALYTDLEEERAEWNAPTDEIVYGPRTLERKEFLSYRITGITDALKMNLLENELAPTLAQLQTSYDTLAPHLRLAHFRAFGYRFHWGDDSDWARFAHLIEEVPVEDIALNEEISTAIINNIWQGVSPEEVVELLKPLYPQLKLDDDFSLYSRAISRAVEYDSTLSAILRDIDVGSFVPGPFYMPSLYLVTRKEGGGHMPFEEAPGLGRNKWINDQFDLFIAKKMQEARVTIFTEEDFQ
jgi:hypothetical protein